jgi:ADP-dependent NAD(P)H-hydrate dehydratase / NAD(P)H-hydrate epimerase
MKILTMAEMGDADRRSAEQFGVPLASLMERAGGAVAAFCLRQYPAARQIVVLCGKGNNGGDGFVAARVLAQAGRSVRVLLLGSANDLKGEAAGAFARMREESSTVPVVEIVEEAALAGAFEHCDLLLDAVVGTGFKPPLRGLAVAARDRIATLTVPVITVDLPSGWDADSTAQNAEGAFRADAVVTFTAPKNAHVFGHLTERTFGPIVVAEIGSPDEAVQSTSGLTWAGASKGIAEKPRDVNSNKGRFGHVLIVGGSYGKAGAPSMSSLAALRAGAGLVTAAVPESILNTVARITPELMVAPLDEISGAVALSNLASASLERLLKGMTVLAIGPGLSTDGEASEFARELVAKTSLPVVIDADALNAFAGRTELLDGAGRTMVLTPHPGEMARLLGKTVKEVEADRTNLARRFTIEHKLTLVLKGWRTLIAHPDGTIAVNTTGNPAMAKGGSGDILTGIVAAMLGQFPGDVARAVETAVYLHGLAADFATHAMDEHTVLATDTLAHLTDAFRYRVKDADGLTWLVGIHR